MKKVKKKLKEKKAVEEQTESKELSKIEVMQIVDHLKASQYSCMVEENFEKAMQYANQIIEYAIRYKMSYFIKEQDEILKNIAKKVQKKFYTSEIERECLRLNEDYDKFVESNDVEQAHEYLENFKQKHADKPVFETLPFVKALIEKDRKIWIKYISVPR